MHRTGKSFDGNCMYCEKSISEIDGGRILGFSFAVQKYIFSMKVSLENCILRKSLLQRLARIRKGVSTQTENPFACSFASPATFFTTKRKRFLGEITKYNIFCNALHHFQDNKLLLLVLCCLIITIFNLLPTRWFKL